MKNVGKILFLLLPTPLAVEGTPGTPWGGIVRIASHRRDPITSPRWALGGHHADKRKISYSKFKPKNDNMESFDLLAGYHASAAQTMRAGYQGTIEPPTTLETLDKTVSAVIKILTSTARIILPPTVATVRAVVAFYAALPVDALLAQAGLVYAFAGGYFPTLFAAIQAAEHCGWETAVEAVDCLATEAVAAIRACDLPNTSQWNPRERREMNAGRIFTEKTMIVLKTIDPMKINQAVASLYTTWMGISIVLEKQFARTIALSVTIGQYIHPFANFIIATPSYRVIPRDYHKWVPVMVGWTCKAAAMSIAWRIERVITAYSSAIAGGLMFSRSIFRMLRKRGVKLLGIIPEDHETSYLDEFLGLSIGGLGLYTQLRSQIGSGFSFRIPFPLNLVTWPFEIAERWIQWTITKDVV